MPLFGTLNLANSAPQWNVGAGLGIVGNGRQIFANTGPNTLHPNVTVGVFGATSTKVAVDAPIGAPGAGYQINDLLTISNTGAQGVSNVDLSVNRLGVVYANVFLAGTGYANGTIVQITGANQKPCRLNVTVGSAVVGNVSTVAIVDGGMYTANLAAANLVTTVLTGAAGVGFSVNVGTGIATVNVHNSGSYVVPPTTLNLASLVGGSGGGGKANLTLGYNAQVAGGSGWVLRTAQENGQVQYEILVASGSMQTNVAEYSITP